MRIVVGLLTMRKSTATKFIYIGINVFHSRDILPLPGLTPEKYKVSLYCFRDFEPSKVTNSFKDWCSKIDYFPLFHSRCTIRRTHAPFSW